MKISNPTLGTALRLRLTPSNNAGVSPLDGRTESDSCESKPALSECTVSLHNLEIDTKPWSNVTPTNEMPQWCVFEGLQMAQNSESADKSLVMLSHSQGVQLHVKIALTSCTNLHSVAMSGPTQGESFDTIAPNFQLPGG